MILYNLIAIIAQPLIILILAAMVAKPLIAQTLLTTKIITPTNKLTQLPTAIVEPLLILPAQKQPVRRGLDHHNWVF